MNEAVLLVVLPLSVPRKEVASRAGGSRHQDLCEIVVVLGVKFPEQSVCNLSKFVHISPGR